MNESNQQSVADDVFEVMTANEWSNRASEEREPSNLWRNMWREGELGCLFSDSNLGKSILAVQIAAELTAASTKSVIYFDFEMSSKQFQMRYMYRGEPYRFSDSFLRAEINPYALATSTAPGQRQRDGSFEDSIVEAIERTALAHNVKIVIIDNITYLNSVTECGDSAGSLMIKLMQLKKRHGLTMLILAHTPKRPLNAPLTQNDLAGSKKLFNFFDTVIAIGRSAKDPELRYIKQLKSRSGQLEYDENEVLVCEIRHQNHLLSFVDKEISTEADHIEHTDIQDRVLLLEKVRRLRRQCKSVTDIARELGLSRATAGRLVQRVAQS